MGSIYTKIIVLSDNLNPGETHGWTWNNPHIDNVYAFSAATHSNGSAPNSDLRVEISPIRYNYNNGTGKRRIEFSVKNVSSTQLNYEIHMSTATPI